ncbi:expressed unknown protein [Seminavis robusta]|uniref:Uncharacterized protein n=1 Tax=Seminavis robusta TaxID=568900 RepID=A0A9N8HF33_9STRA|nr:expressed unknown protein [Seminavis robusta]|eukprot:Sro547_g164280.1 n/a (207) ;mRNA; r:42647-43267
MEFGPQEHHQASFEPVFDEIHKQVQDAIKLPLFATEMKSSFSTSTATHVIASQINLMEGLQEFFEYSVSYMGCGLKRLEMMGTVEDWEHLREKFRRVRELLEPIKSHLEMYLPNEWWACVEMVFDNLLLTVKEPALVGTFWRNILLQAPPHWVTDYYGKKGKGMRHREQVDAYDGWVVRFLGGNTDILCNNDVHDIVIDGETRSTR